MPIAFLRVECENQPTFSQRSTFACLGIPLCLLTPTMLSLERFHSFYSLTSENYFKVLLLVRLHLIKFLESKIVALPFRLSSWSCLHGQKLLLVGQFAELLQLVFHLHLPPFWKTVTFLSALQFASGVLSVGGTGLYWELSWKAVAGDDSSNSHRPYVEAPRPFLTHQQT